MLIDQQNGDILSLSVILEGRLDDIRLRLYHNVSSTHINDLSTGETY
jgi:hypothetical protein